MFEQYQRAKDELCKCVNQWISIAEGIGEKRLVDELKMQMSELRKLRFNIAVLGNIKRGKSTLINTLLGQKDDSLSPIDAKVCTGGIVHYMDVSCLPDTEKDHERERAYVYYKDQEEPQEIDLDEIGEYIREEKNPKNIKGIDRVEVYGHFPRLHDCCLVDTPGADAVIEHHSELAFGFLPHADAIIMTILSAEALTDADQRILDAIGAEAQKRVFYVVTQIDTIREDERQIVLNYVKGKIEEFGLHAPRGKIYPVACKKVFDAMREEDGELANLREVCGVAKLEGDLEKFILDSSREGRNIRDSLLDVYSQLETALQNKQKLNESLIQQQEVDVSQIERDREKVEQIFKDFQRDVKDKLAHFERKWDRCTRSCVANLSNLVPKLEDKLGEALDRAGTLGSIANLFSVTAIVKKASQLPIQDFLDNSSDKYNEIIREFKEEVADTVQLHKGRVSNLSAAAAEGYVGGVGILAAAGYFLSDAGSAIEGLSSALGTSSTLNDSWGWIPKFFFNLFYTPGKAVTTKGLFTAFSGSIWPILIAIVAVKLAGPVAKMLVEKIGGKSIGKIIEEVEGNFMKQAEAQKKEFVMHVEEQLSDEEEKTNHQVKELEMKLRNLSPEIKQKAIDENKRIEALLDEGAGQKRFIQNKLKV